MAAPITPGLTSTITTHAIVSLSLVEQKRDLLIKIVGETALARIHELPENTFDTRLWEHLALKDFDDYHTKMSTEFSTKIIWLQKDRSSKHGFSLHLTGPQGWIHAVGLQKNLDTVIIESRHFHASKGLNTPQFSPQERTAGPFNIGRRGSISYRAQSTQEFMKNISFVFSNCSLPEQISPSIEAIQFKKRLELLPIEVRATKMACLQLESWRELYVQNKAGGISIGLGVPDETGTFDPLEKKGDALIEIPQKFLAYRLPTLYDRQRHFGDVTERVASAFCSREALAQEPLFKNAGYHLSRERLVACLEHLPPQRPLKDLCACFFVATEPSVIAQIHTETLPPKEAPEDSLDIFIDCREDGLRVQTQFKGRITV